LSFSTNLSGFGSQFSRTYTNKKLWKRIPEGLIQWGRRWIRHSVSTNLLLPRRALWLLKGLGHEIFYFWLFHEISSPNPIQVAQFRHSHLQVRRCAGVVDTGGGVLSCECLSKFLKNFDTVPFTVYIFHLVISAKIQVNLCDLFCLKRNVREDRDLNTFIYQ
jgi:hypothetical protein